MTNRSHQKLGKPTTPKLGKPTTPKLGKPTTLNPQYKCDTCGEPAMVVEMDRFFSCPDCYLKRLGKKIKGLDHAGYYP